MYDQVNFDPFPFIQKSGLVLTARSSRSAGTFPCRVCGVSMEMDSAIHHNTLTRNGRGLAKGDNLIGNVVN